ncbi:MAG: hypothetical protein GY913_05445 [Proteobacteria bacterium]|nr:hypothetical protein [Pseudomonadota bacterium]
MASFSVEDGLAFVALGNEDLDGLDVQVGNALSLYENEQLTSLDGVGVTAPTSVYISGAPNLASVEALSELSTLTSL